MATVIGPIHLAVTVVFLAISSLVLASAANRSPKISLALPYSKKKGVLYLSEDTPLNSFVAFMEAKDDDSGPAGEVECVTDNPYINIPLVYPATYKVELVKELDREEVNLVQVSILCSDKGVPPMTATAIFTIEIIDINDNAPIFAKSVYNANVTEGVPIGTVVTRVKATDADFELNGNVEYSLQEDISNISHFTIDKESGKIFSKADIDREVISHYVLTVVAKDSGLPSLSSSVQVRIQVEDVNDNAPVILTKELHANENEKPMSLVGNLQANDPDVGKNSELVFSKEEDSESSSTAPFLIYPNGEVLSAVSLDREQRQHYTMEVAVRDKGNPRLSSKATISIFVDDVNDNAPIITSECLTDDSYDDSDDFTDTSNQLASNFSTGLISIDWYSHEDRRLVYQIEAVDEDSGENSKLRYTIESVTSGGALNSTTITDALFEIDNTTGEIYLRRYVRKNDNLIQILNINVTDSGNPPFSAFCRLNITVAVDVSMLTTPKTTKVKGKSNTKSSTQRNAAANILPISSMSIIRHLFLSLIVSLLVCVLNYLASN